MKRLFLSITKGDRIRFLGHLDFLRTLERAVMRARIPAAFSEGFNPHMRIALDAALGVGVAADPIYMELGLERDMTPEEVKDRLAPQLLDGIVIHGIREAEPGWPKLIHFLNEDCYVAEGPVAGLADPEEVKTQVERFNRLKTLPYQRVTPKKVREVDIMPLLTEPISVSVRENRAYLTFSFVRTKEGSIQPRDLWKVLAESFHMPWTPGEFVCTRCGSYHREGSKRITPFDEDAFASAAERQKA